MGLVRLIGSFLGDRRGPSIEELRKSVPLRSAQASERDCEDGGIELALPLDQFRAYRWVPRGLSPQGEKRFELESVGATVWRLCDGRHTFDAIARQLVSKFGMNRLEAEASLAAFLQMLGKRGLVELKVKKKR